jgi:hypothetical protein
MEVTMIQSKIKPDGVADVSAAIDKMLVSLDAAHPDGIRYASLLQPDGETFVVLLHLDDGLENPLQELPAYKELLEIVEGRRAAPPVVEKWTLTGSYRVF